MTEPEKNILHIFGELKPSGGETMLATALPYFRSRRLLTSVLSTGEIPGSCAPVLAEAGATIHHIPFAKKASFAAAVLRLMRKGGFDTVHIHTERAYFYYALLAWHARIPQILRTVHHIFPWRGWLRWRTLVQRHLSAHICGCVFISNSMSGLANEWSCYRMRNLLIPNWYDSNRFVPRSVYGCRAARRALGLHEGEINIVSLGGNASLTRTFIL